jgi:4-hydroxy-tetrahydrodipicolinate synthase
MYNPRHIVNFFNNEIIKMFKGAITALITPFKGDMVDEKAFQGLVEWQIKEGIHGLVPCGTTGESPTLTHDEHNRLIKLCVEVAGGRVPVIAGTGSNATLEAIALSKNAEKSGADAVLIAAPYYNKPNQEGLFRHYKAINDAIGIPIIIYNIPGRSVIDIADETTVRMSTELKNVVGIKDATGNLVRVSTLKMRLAERKFCQLSGDDGTAIAFNAQGGMGCISVTSNIAPKMVAEVQNLWFSGKNIEALQLHDKLMPLHLAMFCDTSPGPAKYAASLMRLCSPDVRLPITEPGEDKKLIVKKAMEMLGIV